MGNKKFSEAVKMRELFDECMEEGVTNVAAIRDYMLSHGIAASYNTVAKLLREKGVKPKRFAYKHNPGKE